MDPNTENLKEHKNALNRIENKAEHVTSKIKEKTDKIFEERNTHRTDNVSTKRDTGSCVGSYSVSGFF